MLTRLVLKSLWIDRKSSISFVVALSVGLVGLCVIFAARTAIDEHMGKKAQEILSADLSVSARRIFTSDEHLKIRGAISHQKILRTYSLFTMLAGGEGSRLTYLKAIPEEFPFYGELKSQNGKALNFDGGSVIYGDQQLFDQLQVKVGDSIKVGNHDFILKGLIEEDSTRSLRFSALAPKAYIHREDLAKTKLIGFGSTVSETIYIKEPSKQRALELKTNLIKSIADNSIQIQTADEAAQGSVRALSYLADYLGLISLVGFLLSSLGAGFIFFESLSKQLKTFSIFQSLGLSRKKSLGYLLLQITILSLCASVITLLISHPLFALCSDLLKNQLDLEIQLRLRPQIFLWIFLLSYVSALIMSLPHFWALLKAPMRNLLDENSQGLNLERAGIFIALTAFVFLFTVSLVLSRSFKVSAMFTVGLAFIFISVGALGLGLTSLLKRWALKSWVKIVYQEMNGKKKTQLILFSVMTLSVLMIDSIKQIEHSLQRQLAVSSDSEIPAYFLFDIQDEQIAPLKNAIEDQGLELLQPSPMVRAKMISINGSSYEVASEEDRFETREDEEEARFRNRGLNLSYRSELNPGESLASGDPLTERYIPGGLLELSVEDDYARRVKMKIGDKVQMDIQGLMVEGVVKNLRRVSWTTFLPNFFVIAQPGYLEDAPKTWLAGLSRGDDAKLKPALSRLNKEFPNVSFVNLDEVIKKIREITGQMSYALFLSALLVLIAGLFILLSVSRFHFFESQKDLNLLKILGADSKFLAKKVALEQATLVLICLALGLGGSFILSYQLLERLFETKLHWSFETPVILTLGLILLSALMTFLAHRWSQSTNPKSFL